LTIQTHIFYIARHAAKVLGLMKSKPEVKGKTVKFRCMPADAVTGDDACTMPLFRTLLEGKAQVSG
jgi:hypothetical protein